MVQEKLDQLSKITGGSPFLNRYVDELLHLSRLKHNFKSVEDMTADALDKVIKILVEFIDTLFVDLKVRCTNSVEDLDYIEDFIALMDFLEFEEKAFFNYEGTVFSSDVSPIANLLDKMLKDRNIYKHKMLVCKSEGDTSNAVVNDNKQKVKKEIANSLYGVLGLMQFFLFNKDVAQSITGNCAVQLQNLITQAEKVFGSRTILRDDSELFDFLVFNTSTNYIHIDVETAKTFFIDGTTYITREELLVKLNSFIKYNKSPETDNIISSFVDSIVADPLLLIRFTFLNDVNKFFSCTNFLTDFIVRQQDNILSLNDFNEKSFNAALNTELRPFLESFVFDASIQDKQLDLCENYEREIVLMSDKLRVRQ